jgi:hypothetical protein
MRSCCFIIIFFFFFITLLFVTSKFTKHNALECFGVAKMLNRQGRPVIDFEDDVASPQEAISHTLNEMNFNDSHEANLFALLSK